VSSLARRAAAQRRDDRGGAALGALIGAVPERAKPRLSEQRGAAALENGVQVLTKGQQVKIPSERAGFSRCSSHWILRYFPGRKMRPHSTRTSHHGS